MTSKRKRKARALSAKTGMSHQAAINVLTEDDVAADPTGLGVDPQEFKYLSGVIPRPKFGTRSYPNPSQASRIIMEALFTDLEQVKRACGVGEVLPRNFFSDLEPSDLPLPQRMTKSPLSEIQLSESQQTLEKVGYDIPLDPAFFEEPSVVARIVAVSLPSCNPRETLDPIFTKNNRDRAMEWAHARDLAAVLEELPPIPASPEELKTHLQRLNELAELAESSTESLEPLRNRRSRVRVPGSIP